MHIEVLVEDRSGKTLLENLMPRIIGPMGDPHTWRIIGYKGVGRIPRDLAAKADPQKRILLDRLPRLLQGYGRSPGIDAVAVVVDSDERNCREFLRELNKALFALAVGNVRGAKVGSSLFHVGKRRSSLPASR